jgi:SAM-dependent methyltransferase
MSHALAERTVGGVHDFLLTRVLPLYVNADAHVIDLGAGSGALATRIGRELNARVEAADADATAFGGEVPFRTIDLNRDDLANELGGRFDCVIAVEVIEHLDSPLRFLRSVRAALSPNGRAILTTPNVDNVPARVKFLLTDRIRMMDAGGDPTHISPIFWDLLTRQLLPLAGLRLERHYTYPERGYVVTRPLYERAFKLLAPLLRGPAPYGDCHVLVLAPDRPTT